MLRSAGKLSTPCRKFANSPTVRFVVLFGTAYSWQLIFFRVMPSNLILNASCSVKAHHYGASNPAKFTMSSPEQDKATVIILPMRV